MPITPENGIVKHYQRESMWGMFCLQNHVLIVPIEIRICNVIQMSICPPDFIREVIDRQSIRPSQIITGNC